MIMRLYAQMLGFIMEISLKYAKFHWHKYTVSSARSLIDKINALQPPSSTYSTLLIDIAFSEFYTFAGFINNDLTELEKATTQIAKVFSRIGVDF